jgi:hypothetical protein
MSSRNRSYVPVHDDVNFHAALEIPSVQGGPTLGAPAIDKRVGG